MLIRLIILSLFSSCYPLDYKIGQSPSYKTDLLPIIKKRCVMCHNTYPLNWLEYAIVFKNKKKIYTRVVIQKNMPPFKIGIGIQEDEIQMFKDWYMNGAKE